MPKYSPGDKIAVSARVIQAFTNKRTGAPHLTILINGTQLTIGEDAVLQEALEKPPIKKGDIVATFKKLTDKPQYKVIYVEDDFAMCKSIEYLHKIQMFHVSELIRIEE